MIDEPDDGIYDAMNKGLKLSSGRFVWFLNGGDEAESASLRSILEIGPHGLDSVHLFSYVLRLGRRDIHRPSRPPGYMWHGLPTSHQAIIYPGGFARSSPYELEYSLVGDYAFTARFLCAEVPFVVHRAALARFHADGVSMHQAKDVSRQARLVQKRILKTSRRRQSLSRVRHMASRNARAILTRLSA